MVREKLVHDPSRDRKGAVFTEMNHPLPHGRGLEKTSHTPSKLLSPSPCVCGSPSRDTGPGKKAVGVDPAGKTRNLARLRRIEGQIRGLHKMVEDDRYCADILGQLSAVHEALRAVGRELLRNHLKHCATDAIKKGSTKAEAMYDELVELMYKNAR
jgi:DNA-binding FrmR family transcriptional regulator